MLAGPNGSGKTSLLRSLRDEHHVPLGFNLNPDDLQAALIAVGRISLSDFGLTATTDDLRTFCRAHPMTRGVDAGDLSVSGGDLLLAGQRPSAYMAAVLADWLRQQWVMGRQSFTYETVMSSGDKVDLLERARLEGYRTYTYFVCTSQPLINVDRVAFRVTQGGHNVPADKIIARHARSLAHLPRAVAASDRAYLFDNSGASHRLVAEYDAGRLIAASPALPNWFLTTMLNARPLR